MTTITHVPATPGQIKQINRFGSDAIEKVFDELSLDKPGAQRVIENGDEFACAIRTAALASLKDLSVSDKYKNEEWYSDYTYPSEYDGPKPIKEQITALAEIFGFDPAHALEYAKNLPELPAGAEGWFAIPSQRGLKKLFPQIENEKARYCAGVRFVHEKIASSRKFCNYRDGLITPNHLRLCARTAYALYLIAKNQFGDILIVAGQLGMHHRGRSTRRARECFKGRHRAPETLLSGDEFGLDSLAGGSIVLVHPNRLVRWGDLGMDCPGDEFDYPYINDRFTHVPSFSSGGGVVTYDTYSYGDDHNLALHGSVSAFVL